MFHWPRHVDLPVSCTFFAVSFSADDRLGDGQLDTASGVGAFLESVTI